MNDIQEDRFGMFLKTSHFLSVNSADLAANPEIATFKTQLDAQIDNIVQQDVIATTDITGYTEQKANAEKALEDILLHVSRGLTGYFTAQGDIAMVRKVDFTKTEVVQSRDADLNTKAELIHQIADPIKALLAPNMVTPANVDILNLSRLAFLSFFNLPREKEGDSKAAREQLARLHELVTKELDLKLDSYMAVYESVNEALFSKYKTARMIDNSGGGSGSEGFNLQNYTVPAGGLVQIGATPLPAREIYLRNLSPGSVVICTTDGTTGPCASGYTLNGNTLFKNTFGTLGLNQALPIVQVSNAGAEDVIIRAGTKAE